MNKSWFSFKSSVAFDEHLVQVKRIVPTKDCSNHSLPVVVKSRSRLGKSNMTRSPQLLWDVWYSRGLQSCRGYGYGLNMAQPYLRKKLFVYEERNVHCTFVWPSHVAYVVSVFCDSKRGTRLSIYFTSSVIW